MAYTHAVPTNKFGVTQLIVANSPANGSHTTLASAIADAVSGDTIFLRDSVTENVTLPAGVNIASWNGSSLNVASITGTITMTAAGTSNISGIRLVTNSASFLAVTGSAASIINLENCYLNCSNNTGISFTSSSSSATINFLNCIGNIGTTGIAFFSQSSPGKLTFYSSIFTNTGGSSTANTISAGILDVRDSQFANPFTSSSTGGIDFAFTAIDTTPQNVSCLTVGGSGGHTAFYSSYSSGSASAITISQSLTAVGVQISSTNTNGITGAGTLVNAGLYLSHASQAINVTTQLPKSFSVGGITFDGGINLLSQYAVGTFTPSYQGQTTAGTTTYSYRLGFYVRIGQLISISVSVSVTAATGTGNAVIAGLPFTIQNTGNYFPTGPLNVSQIIWPASTTSLYAAGINNSTFMQLNSTGSNVANANIQLANFINMHSSLNYEV